MLHPQCHTTLPSQPLSSVCTRPYDIIIVGAGVAGSAFAYALTDIAKVKARDRAPEILLIDRDLSQPDRIVGELLQPGGCLCLRRLGLRDCLDQIDAVEVNGYAVYGDQQHSLKRKSTCLTLPYPPESTPMDWIDGALYGDQSRSTQPRRQQGRSFHHGRFVQRLRAKAMSRSTVTLLQATVTDLLRCEKTDRVIGVSFKDSEDRTASVYAPLTIVADGCFSKFRRSIAPPGFRQPLVRSHFVGLMLDTPDPVESIPYPGHGHVILPTDDQTSLLEGELPVGPVLVYQIGKAETRMLVDVPGPKVPSIGNGNLRSYLEKQVGPMLPPSLLESFYQALDSTDPSRRLRVMPNSYLPPHRQDSQEGVILLGDSMNMRHPLTGGGMTVALNDVEILSELLGSIESLEDWCSVEGCLDEWYWSRKSTSICINVLAQALYNLFGAQDSNLEILKQGCLRYFELGGDRVTGPISLLSALIPSPILLIYHFFSVAFFSIYILVLKEKSWFNPLKVLDVFWSACVTILPVLWSEI
ncbi:squalene monooxygenase [Phakopsora pachyrhizi]|nr:squalene monooxygenase [Phakopsora pachyrhizi]